MGQSTDGLFWFGLASSDEGFPNGVEERLKSFVPEGKNFDDDPIGYADKALMKFGCQIVQHCSCEYPMYGVAVSSSRYMAWRGSPRNVIPMHPNQEQTKLLKQACEAIGWPWSEPCFWLASNWC